MASEFVNAVFDSKDAQLTERYIFDLKEHERLRSNLIQAAKMWRDHPSYGMLLEAEIDALNTFESSHGLKES